MGPGRASLGMIVAQPDETNTDLPRSETIEELFAALESPLLNYAYRFVHELSIAEDLVQDAFMKLHAQFAEVREPRRWLYRTVHNLAVNYRVRSGKIVPLELPGTPDSSSDVIDPQLRPDEVITRLEGISMVRLSVETLDDRSRELIRLKFNDNLSYKEISERTGLTTGHVGYLLHHALKAVAADLAKTGVIP